MFQRLTNPESVELARQQITTLVHQHPEWFCSSGKGQTNALHRDEIELNITEDRLVLTCWTEKGNRNWRILAWQWTGQILLLQTSRRFGATEPLIELIPRSSAKFVAATIKAARQLRCERMARLAADLRPNTRTERIALSPGIRRGQPGKYARILLRRKRDRIAVTASVVAMQHSTVDAFLSSALLWFRRNSEKSGPPYLTELWLIVPESILRPLFFRLCLLRESLRNSIRVFKVDSDLSMLEELPCPAREKLWKKRLARFPPVPPANLTKLTTAILGEAPAAIDVVHARHGETLRYFGLPFARVRTLLGEQRVWFGVDGSHRQVLDHENLSQWSKLMADLRQYRSAAAVDRRHALYRNAAEAWLESLLRKDITQLDPGLIIAPLHAQFRTTHGGKLGIRPIDMLALRQDGRLVVIELKVSEDREHVLQGADYWRRVEAHRRRGHIARAKLFGEREISDESPLVYLVAPTLRVHPSFQTLAQCIDRAIEVYRFDINDDWRLGVRVMRRIRVN
jgi:hypothetical protein